MFTLLFAAVGEFLLWVGGAYVVYRVVFYSSIKKKKELKLQKENAEKLSSLILKSSSPKEISEFMKNNVSFLSKETFTKLNEHLEFTNVLSEEPLKARFENLEPVSEEEELEEVLNANKANFTA